MSQGVAKSLWHAAAVRWSVWLAYVALWTTGLVIPLGDGSHLGELEQNLRFYVGKSLHVVGYAVLTILSSWLVVSVPRRLVLVFFAGVHATATEILQDLISNRTGCVTDVGLDHLGIGLGLVLTWRWWSEPT